MKKFIGIVCLLYAVIIIYSFANNSIGNYLAPNMHIYLKLSVVPLIMCGIVIISYKNHYNFKPSDLILLLPLLMLFFTMDGKLSLTLANNRITNNKVEFNSENNTTIEDDDIEYDFSTIDFDIKDPEYDELANYITFHPNSKKYIGKKIRVRGFTVTQGALLPNGYFLIGKYLMNCCAADTIYTPFFAKYDQEVKDNTWYEIEGVLEQLPSNDAGYMLAIKVINIKPISESSEDIYIYQCYAYDNGLCNSSKKYNLEY